MTQVKGTAEATTSYPDGSNATESHVVEGPASKTPDDGVPYAMIEYSFGGTINTGKYENVKVHVGITLPAKLSEIDEVFGFAVSWVDDKLAAQHAEIAKLYNL